MTISINGITDISGNVVTPLTTHFTTLNGADTTQPFVTSTNITSGETHVPINSSVIFQFSKAMDSRTLNGTNFYVYDLDFGVYIPVTYSYSADGLTATMVPVSPLPVGRNIQIGARNSQDLAGNAIVNLAINFSTAYASSTTPPTVSDTTPRNGATGIPTNATLQILFSEAIEPTALAGIQLLKGGTPQAIAPSLSSANNILKLIPSTLLLPNTQYTLSISGATDAAGKRAGEPRNRYFHHGTRRAVCRANGCLVHPNLQRNQCADQRRAQAGFQRTHQSDFADGRECPALQLRPEPVSSRRRDRESEPAYGDLRTHISARAR